MEPNLRFWKRLKDDIFLIWDGSDDELDQFVHTLNTKEPRIQFTVEKDKDGQLPFLDLLVYIKDDKLCTKVYRKPTHTQRYIQWSSNHPKNILLGVLKGLIHRAHIFCDDKKDLCEELELLTDVFVSNGYPRKLVQKTVAKSWEVEMQKWIKKNIENLENKVETQEFYDVIHAPYVEGFSEKVQRHLKKFNVGFVMKVEDNIQSYVSHLKAPVGLMNQKDVVYAIRCRTCDMNYIGETGQSFIERKKQHQRAVRNGIETNGIFQHVQANVSHEIDWENPVFLDKERNWMARKIKESIRINAINPMPVITTIMNLEKGKDIDSIWNRFDKDVGEQTRIILSRDLRAT